MEEDRRFLAAMQALHGANSRISLKAGFGSWASTAAMMCVLKRQGVDMETVASAEQDIQEQLSQKAEDLGFIREQLASSLKEREEAHTECSLSDHMFGLQKLNMLLRAHTLAGLARAMEVWRWTRMAQEHDSGVSCGKESCTAQLRVDLKEVEAQISECNETLAEIDGQWQYIQFAPETRLPRPPNLMGVKAEFIRTAASLLSNLQVLRILSMWYLHCQVGQALVCDVESLYSTCS